MAEATFHAWFIYFLPWLSPSKDANLHQHLLMNCCWAFCAGIHSWRQAHYSLNLACRGSFLQITNMVISLLIQTGSSFSNAVNCHEAVKQSVTLVWKNNDEKWHTGAALACELFPSLCDLTTAVFFLQYVSDRSFFFYQFC